VPIQFIALAKAAAVITPAMSQLAEWNKLDSEQKARLREPAFEVMRGLNELRRAVGHRLFKQDALTYEAARAKALDPSIAFRMAKRVVDVVVDKERMSHDDLATALGAVGSNDTVFAEALKIAKDDGYVRRDGADWVVTEFGDRDLIESEHVVYIERCIVEYIDQFGVTGRDALAEAVGAPSFESEVFRAALERALTSGSVQWLENGLYGLPADRLVNFDAGATDEPEPAAREIKAIVGDLAAAVGRLRRAAGDAHRGPSTPALTSGQRAATNVDSLERLALLKQLLDAGAISHQEFADQKARLLSAN
jgi:hypothetical protein